VRDGGGMNGVARVARGRRQPGWREGGPEPVLPAMEEGGGGSAGRTVHQSFVWTPTIFS
jgi:hypothetical protein